MKMKINCSEQNKFKTKESNENVVLIETKGLSMEDPAKFRIKFFEFVA